MGVGLFVGVWVARYLGPEQFGLMNYALAFVGLFGSVATLGLDGIVVRDIVRYPQGKYEILGTAFGVKLVGGLGAFALALATIAYFRPGDALSRWLVAIFAACLVFQSLDTIDLWFQSQVQSKFTVWVRTAAFAIISLIKLVLILNQAPLLAFAWAALGETLLGSILLIFAYKANGYSLIIWCFSLRRVKKLLRESWPVLLSSIMVALYIRIDQVMLGGMVGDKAVGIYSAAVRLSEIWYFLPMIIGSSLFPSLIKSKELGNQLYLARVQKYYDLNIMLSYFIIIPTTFLSLRIVSTLYGNLYIESSAIFSLHIWGILFVFLGVSRSQFLLIEGMLRHSFLCTFIGCASNILINLWLIPLYGPIGAALSTIISFALSGYISSFIFPKLYYIGIMQSKALLIPFRLILYIINKYAYCLSSVNLL
jgi:PST family polysaccharide transporter